MTFALPEDITDAATQLRSFEPQAPKHMKAAMVAAAAQLEGNTRLMAQCAEELEQAATLRVGAADTESRAIEVQRVVRMTILDIATRLRTA